MPYIKESRKSDFSFLIREIVGRKPSSGDLNYIISKIFQELVIESGQSYELYNSLIGVLECAKLELYRRKVSLYEDEKIKINGDI